MKAQNINKTSLIQARVSPKELETITANFHKSTCQKLSDYIRKVLLNKPVTVKLRNQSLDDCMQEMIRLRGELNAIGNNYNQVVKRLHSLKHFEEVKQWLKLHDSAGKILLEKLSEIKSKINQIDEVWLR